MDISKNQYRSTGGKRGFVSSFFILGRILEHSSITENSNTGIKEWRTNLAKTGDQRALDGQCEEALIESQVNYLKFDIFGSNFLRRIQIHTGITEWRTNLAKTRDQ